MNSPLFLTVLLFSIVITNTFVEAKILAQCDAVKELRKNGVSNTFISNWICLMKSESGFNTNLVKGPGTAASYSYGILQISSLNNKYCIRGRKGGACNQKCEDFANDDITDDIVCAQIIQKAEGFKYWKGWLNKCKSKPLPDVTNCKQLRRRWSIQDEINL